MSWFWPESGCLFSLSYFLLLSWFFASSVFKLFLSRFCCLNFDRKTGGTRRGTEGMREKEGEGRRKRRRRRREQMGHALGSAELRLSRAKMHKRVSRLGMFLWDFWGPFLALTSLESLVSGGKWILPCHFCIGLLVTLGKNTGRRHIYIHIYIYTYRIIIWAKFGHFNGY